jgi:hypothetical protein
MSPCSLNCHDTAPISAIDPQDFHRAVLIDCEVLLVLEVTAFIKIADQLGQYHS